MSLLCWESCRSNKQLGCWCKVIEPTQTSFGGLIIHKILILGKTCYHEYIITIDFHITCISGTVQKCLLRCLLARVKNNPVEIRMQPYN